MCLFLFTEVIRTDWTLHQDGFEYLVNLDDRSFDSARKWCSGEKSDLVKVNDESLHTSLLSQILKKFCDYG